MGLDHYEVGEVIARVGGVTVHAARDLDAWWDVGVALHVLHEHAGLAERTTFIAQAEEHRAPVHPLFCRTLALGSAARRCYRVTEALGGRSLAVLSAQLCEKPALFEQAGWARHLVALVREIARALAIRRVLAPERPWPVLGLANLFVLDDGEVRLADALQAGPPAGQDEGAPVRALAEILWQLLTGCRPVRVALRGDQLVAAHQPVLDAPSRHRPGIDAGLDALVERALTGAPEVADLPGFVRALARCAGPPTGWSGLRQRRRWLRETANDFGSRP